MILSLSGANPSSTLLAPSATAAPMETPLALEAGSSPPMVISPSTIVASSIIIPPNAEERWPPSLGP